MVIEARLSDMFVGNIFGKFGTRVVQVLSARSPPYMDYWTHILEFFVLVDHLDPVFEASIVSILTDASEMAIGRHSLGRCETTTCVPRSFVDIAGSGGRGAI